MGPVLESEIRAEKRAKVMFWLIPLLLLVLVFLLWHQTLYSRGVTGTWISNWDYGSEELTFTANGFYEWHNDANGHRETYSYEQDYWNREIVIYDEEGNIKDQFSYRKRGKHLILYYGSYEYEYDRVR